MSGLIIALSAMVAALLDREDDDGAPYVRIALSDGTPVEDYEPWEISAYVASLGGPRKAALHEHLDWLVEHGYKVRLVGDDWEPTEYRAAPGGLFRVQHSEGLKKYKRIPPKAPRNPLDGEDRVTPRVSMASSIEGAISGVITCIPRTGISVYTNKTAVNAIVPSPLLVPDAAVTGEVWLMSQETLVPVGTIDSNILFDDLCQVDDDADRPALVLERLNVTHALGPMGPRHALWLASQYVRLASRSGSSWEDGEWSPWKALEWDDGDSGWLDLLKSGQMSRDSACFTVPEALPAPLDRPFPMVPVTVCSELVGDNIRFTVSGKNQLAMEAVAGRIEQTCWYFPGGADKTPFLRENITLEIL